MRWFKHSSTASDEPNLAALEDKFGLAGYAMYFKVLEVITKEIGNSSRTSVSYPVGKWRKSVGVSAGKLQLFVNFSSQLEIFQSYYDKNGLTISWPNLAIYRDEYTKKALRKSGGCPDNVLVDKKREDKIRREEIREDAKAGLSSFSFSSFLEKTQFVLKTGDRMEKNQDALNVSYEKLLSEDYTSDDILDAADKYSRTVCGNDPKYTYGLKTFLSSAIYEWIKRAPVEKQLTPDELKAKDELRARIYAEVEAKSQQTKNNINNTIANAKLKVTG